MATTRRQAARRRPYPSITLGETQQKHGCVHVLNERRYKRCAACGELICAQCRRPALLPGKFVCKFGCPVNQVRNTELNFPARYTAQLHRKAGRG